ncbi:MAG: DUF2948 family protein [Candidatus Puniceispirillaceae bacterium]
MNDRSTPMADQPKLQLKATDSEDIETLSALLQDALIGGSDMAYDKIEGCFVFLANRYCWELEEASYRCLCGVNIRNVRRVQYRNMALTDDPASINQFYNLLALSYDKAEQTLRLIFSDGAELACHLDEVNIIVRDVSAPHPGLRTPDHT